MAAQAIAQKTLIGGRFEIATLLGVGGLGELYLAQDQKTKKPVAIRILASEIARSESITESLRTIVKQASELSDKNIARVFGMGKEGTHRYVASEYIEGQSLRQLVARKKRTGKTFSLKGTYNVLAHICNALDCAHSTMPHGLPGVGSVLINQSGRVKLSDFGLVTALSADSPTLERLGDAHAIAPEVLLSPQSANISSDVYTLGAVLYEMLTGQTLSVPIEPMSNLISDIPTVVEDVVNRCLSSNPEERYESADAVKNAFYQAIQGHMPKIKPNKPKAASTPPPRPAPVMSAPNPISAIPSSPGLQAQASGVNPAPSGLNPISPLQGQLGPKPVAQGANRTIEDMLADHSDETGERWLIQKDNLDFGPFTLGDVKQQMYKGQFSGDDIMVDQEDGSRGPIRKNPFLVEFTRVLERHNQIKNAARDEAESKRRDSRRKTLLMAIVATSLALAVMTAVLIWYFVLREKPQTREKIVYQRGPQLSIKVAFDKEDPAQAKKRRLLKRKKRRGKRRGRRNQGSADDNITRLGDASQGGGDALLSQMVIQQTMSKPANFNKLTPCVQQQWRRQPSLRKVNIAFGIKGSGEVSYTKVNGQSSGPFHSCVSRKMRSIRFPKYDGAMTRASFTMSLNY